MGGREGGRQEGGGEGGRDPEKLNFLVTWPDPLSGLQREFTLTLRPADSSVEMTERRGARKTFLKKTVTSEVGRADLYPGNVVQLLSRRLTVTGYGDPVTAAAMAGAREATLALVLPRGLTQAGHLLAEAQAAGFTLGRARLLQLPSLQAGALLEPSRGSPDFPEQVAELGEGPCLALELLRAGAVSAWLGLVGPEPRDRAVVRGSATVEAARRELALALPGPAAGPGPAWRPGHPSSCCLVRPHALPSAGAILAALQEEGFVILGLRNVLLTFGQADEFLEVYRGLAEGLAWHGETVTELASGPCLALQLGRTEGEVPHCTALHGAGGAGVGPAGGLRPAGPCHRPASPAGLPPGQVSPLSSVLCPLYSVLCPHYRRLISADSGRAL
jgi:nucleoside diphosphate kinase